jgi:hypothetical protein
MKSAAVRFPARCSIALLDPRSCDPEEELGGVMGRFDGMRRRRCPRQAAIVDANRR